MKKIITIGLYLLFCLFANQIFALGIISTNGGFEIAGSGAGAASAAGWSGMPDSALSRTDAAAHSGSWSMELLGGHYDWSHCTQAYNEEDYAGMEIFATVWVMSPSNSSAVAVNDQFGNNSVIFKLEEAGSIEPLVDSFGILNVDAGGVRDQWICLTNIIPVMPSGQQGFSCELIGRMSSGTVYFDDLQVVVVPEPVIIGTLLGIIFFFRKTIQGNKI